MSAALVENYTFLRKAALLTPCACRATATFFHRRAAIGVTTALFATSHPESVHALLGEAQRRSLRMIAGKVLMDQNAPDGVRTAPNKA
jgi:guanine deaminase